MKFTILWMSELQQMDCRMLEFDVWMMNIIKPVTKTTGDLMELNRSRNVSLDVFRLDDITALPARAHKV